MKITDAVHEFILYKQSLGMTYKNRALKLIAFARLAGPVEIDSISPETVRRFLDAGRPVTAEWFNKFSALKMFFRFALSRGYATRNPLPLSQPKNPRQFRPYLYSIEEVRKMMQVVDNRHRGNWHLEPYTIRTLILLLYGTGLRIGEAIRLQHRDVDLNDAILTVRETKFHKTRLVPVSSDLTSVLRGYFERKWKEHGSSTSTPFLATYDGRPVTHLTAELAFKRIRYEAGVKRTDGFYYQPRLHDFRHTFAVRRLVTWYREGKDVQRLLPHLATYLGHVPSGNVALSDDDQGTPGRSEPSLRALRIPRRQSMMNDSLLGPWIRRFLLEHLVAERNLSRNTQRSYRDTLCLLLPRLALQSRTTVDVLEVEDLSADAVRKFLAVIEEERGCSVATRNQRLSAIHALAHFIAERSPEHLMWCGEVQSVPFKRMGKNPLTYLEKAEIDALLASPDPYTQQGRKDHALLLFLYNSGARASEAAGVKISDLNGDERHGGAVRVWREDQAIHPSWASRKEESNRQPDHRSR